LYKIPCETDTGPETIEVTVQLKMPKEFNGEKKKHLLKWQFIEPIAQLPAPEKSMILGQFVGVAMRSELRRQGHTRESRTWRRSGKIAKKGDFTGAGSFAIGSYRYCHGLYVEIRRN
jgi:hypothetical protein